ncbi:GABA permease [Steroidobacter agaridevorans]|uniref:GABA permease n=1 Tax=Steroidobacter agaridevorans TaxID=2695856 RepID=A0A829YC19_9GAMM|nr:amino acid permease [Steroidobacter agaridevorans]GFE80152.1 GABA permease [Steroidobacter agaridevorans]GFE89878.1 GABA permease [Steroidobacter agaridevorans]
MSPTPAATATTGLAKSLRSRHVTMISIGGIIGAGLFVGSSAAISAAGPAITVSYLLAGLVILLVMRMLGEMACVNPGAGSFTEYARIGLGNWAGFVTGWLYWYFWVVVVAIEAIAGAAIIAQWIPLPDWQIGLALMVILTVVNLMSTRSYGEFEFWFASVKVAAIIAFLVIAAGYLIGFTPESEQGVRNLVAHGGFMPRGPIAVLAAITTVIFSLIGAEIAIIAAAESNESARTISRLTVTILLRILLFYVGSIALIVMVIPWTDIQPGISPFVMAMERIGIPGAGLIMNVVVLTAVLSCLNSGVYVTSRVLFTLAAHGDAPQSMVKLSASKVPVRAILLGSSLGYGAVITAVISPSVVFAFLLNTSGAIMLIVYAIVAFAQIRQRRELAPDVLRTLSVRMWLFPYLSWAVIAAIVAVLAAMAFTAELASQLYASVFCTLVVLLAYAARRRSGPAVSPAAAADA